MSEVDQRADTVNITIDGRPMEAAKGTLIIRAAEELGITIPRFCDHPLLDPVAACRQCIVEVEGARKPVTSCSSPVADDMVVRTHLTSEMAAEAQEGQLEFLLINHPLDCPQCDKGGECPLQDQTLTHGPDDSRFIDNKRRYEKPIPISATIALDRERCVLCARCTRFSAEISGDPFIEMFERGALQQVAIYQDKPYHSYFSGNIVQICPVGALTASSYRFGARPFDLHSHDSICNQCSAGCNLRVDVRNHEIQRQLARDNPEVNEMWNCDKGRFGFEWVAEDSRLTHPLVRDSIRDLAPTTWRIALDTAATAIRAATSEHGSDAVGVITGGRLTDEDAYAVSRFTRDVLGTDNVDFRLAPRTGDERDVLAAVAGTQGPTYTDVEHADVTVVAGLDPEEEVGMLYLRLRKAWRRHGQKIVVVGPVLGSLHDIAWRWIPTEVGAEAQALQTLAETTGDAQAQAGSLEEIAATIHDAERVVVLAGERLAASTGALPQAATFATQVGASFAWVPRRSGARGAVDAGLLPGVLPGGRKLDDAGPVADVWNRVPENPGKDTREMLAAAARGDLKVLYLIGVDPIRDFEDPALAEAALRAADCVIVQDLLETDTTVHADIVLPAVASQERVGSFTTWEGRRQPFGQAVPTKGMVQTDWDIVRQLARYLDVDLGWETAMDVRREAAPLMEGAGAASERLGNIAAAESNGHAANGRTDGELDAVLLPWMIGQGSMLRGSKELKATARPSTIWVNPADAESRDLADGQSVTITGPGGELRLPVRVTSQVTTGAVVVPTNSTGSSGLSLNASDDDYAPVPLRVSIAAQES